MKRPLLWLPLLAFAGLLAVVAGGLFRPADRGDPYERIGGDRDSRVQLALGSSGVPESFVVDGRGRTLLQHVGPIDDADVPRIIAAVKRAR